MATCSIEGCDKMARTRGWCPMHYMRWFTNGTTDYVGRKKHVGCTVEGCPNPHRAQGLCSHHYDHLVRRQGNPAPRTYQARGDECSVEGCEKAVYARTWCFKHYENNRLRGDPTHAGPGQGRRPSKWDGVECSVDGCDRAVLARGLCTMHYDRDRRFGDPGEAGMRQAERGEGYVNANGYREFSIKGRHVLEHQIVMSRILGRELLPGENVHHRNGVRSDNRPENLELWIRTQPSGQRARDLVAWAKEIIDRYESVVIDENQRLDL